MAVGRHGSWSGSYVVDLGGGGGGGDDAFGGEGNKASRVSGACVSGAPNVCGAVAGGGATSGNAGVGVVRIGPAGGLMFSPSGSTLARSRTTPQVGWNR